MFKKSALLAALLIAGGTAANAAEIGVRHQHGTSWQNTYGGVRVFESDTKSSTVRDLRAGTLTLSTSGDDSVTAGDLAAALASTEGQAIATRAFQGLNELDAINIPGLESGNISEDDPDAPPSATNAGTGTTGTPDAGVGDDSVTAALSASIVRESYRMGAQTQLNESSLFDSGSMSTFSSVSTFAN